MSQPMEAVAVYRTQRERVYGSTLARVLDKIDAGEYDQYLDLIRFTVSSRIHVLQVTGDPDPTNGDLRTPYGEVLF